MKHIIVLILALIGLAFVPADKPINSDCSCKGIKLWGKVRVVEAHEDFKVRISVHSDLKVRITEHTNKCGEWNFVDTHEDFSIRFVDAHEDFKIEYSDFNGLR
jgi:hypothetical protein